MKMGTMMFDRTARFLTVFGLLGSLQACSSSDDKTSTGNQDSAPVAPTAKLVINELQPSNQDTVTDEKGDADDWIEIYNADTSAVDLKGFVVSDSSGTSQTIPSTLTIEAAGYLLLWADASPGQGANHLGFKLGASKGATVAIADQHGNMLDTVTFGAATGQNTYARFPNGSGSFSWCDKPTPKASNGSACGVP
jgi:hypothetical protein